MANVAIIIETKSLKLHNNNVTKILINGIAKSTMSTFILLSQCAMSAAVGKKLKDSGKGFSVGMKMR